MKGFKVPLSFRVIQGSILAGGGAVFLKMMFPHEAENMLFGVADFVIPIVKICNPNNFNDIALKFARHAQFLIPKDLTADNDVLSASLKDVKFRNPVGLGAGMDKSGEAIEPLLDLGFGFKEVNVAVGADASNDEIETVGKNILRRENRRPYNMCNAPVGICMAGNSRLADTDLKDYSKAIDRIGHLGHYLVIDLRFVDLMADSTWREKIGAILCSVSEARNSANERKKKLKSEFASLVNNKLHCNVPILELPLLVKIPSHLSESELKDILKLIMSTPRWTYNSHDTQGSLILAIDGIIIDEDKSAPKISTLKTLATIFCETDGKVPIVSKGEICSGVDAFEKILSGASFIQVDNLIMDRGAGSIRKIKRELETTLVKSNFNSVQQAVGKDAMQKAQIENVE